MEFLLRQLAYLRANPRALPAKLARLASVLRSGGLAALVGKFRSHAISAQYPRWIETHDKLSAEDRRKIVEHIESLGTLPIISVILPVCDPDLKFLKVAIESVKSQLYPAWELCLIDDASTKPEILEYLQRLADPRIKLFRQQTRSGISAASNLGIENAKGEFLAFLDHDDVLADQALYLVALAFKNEPNLELVYSDEDKLALTGERCDPHFKPDFNLELLRNYNYICHLSAYKRKSVLEIGGLRSAVDGAQDWDLALRVVDRFGPKTVKHLPFILYHWRVSAGSTAGGVAAKSYVREAQQQVVRDHLRRGKVSAQVSWNEGVNCVDLNYQLKSRPLVSVIIPTRDKVSLLKEAIKAVTDFGGYDRVELIIADNGSVEEETKQFFSSHKQLKVVRVPGPFNFSYINNLAASSAAGEVLLFLNNDISASKPGWISAMLAQLHQPGVAIVGSKLLYPNGRIQHAGTILGIGGVAAHSHRLQWGGDPGYFSRVAVAQDLSAVTAACLMLRKEVFLEVQGFDESFAVAFNDLDLCLRIRQFGGRVVYTPKAELIHHESLSRGLDYRTAELDRFNKEISLMRGRWASVLDNDPAYNPNLTLAGEDFSLAEAPRVEKPWLAVSLGIEKEVRSYAANPA